MGFFAWFDSPKEWEGWLISLAVLVAAVFLGLFVYALGFRLFRRWAQGAQQPMALSVGERLKNPLRLLVPLFFIQFFAPLLRLPAEALRSVRQLLAIAFILTVTWLLIKAVRVLRDEILSRYDVTVRDNLKARAVHTQLNVLVKIAQVIIGVIAVATLLMTFEKVRQVGVSILASAGIIGIIIGFAAQRSIATLFAGIQIAVTQPIRIDDVVIVEGEWGRIEEISLTYVVVRIWDLRRLIVPITYFLEKPFQNWTRISADLLGTVYLHADYTMPVEAVRQELHRILKASELWDGKVWGLQVTDATKQTVELRALMSAADASIAWNLRCEVREKLLAFLQKNFPGCLPKVRAELREEAGPGQSPAEPRPAASEVYS